MWLLVIAVVFLPTLLSATGQLTTLLKIVAPRAGDCVRFQTETIHWWSPVRLTDLSVRDVTQSAADEIPVPLMTAETVRTAEPLWQVLTASGRGIHVTIQRPVVNLRTRDGRTNVEETLLHLTGPGSGGEALPVELNITDGTVRLPGNAPNSFGATMLTGISGRVSTLTTASVLPDLQVTASVTSTADSAVTTTSAVRAGINPRIAARLDDLAGDFSLQPFTDAQMAELAAAEQESSLSIRLLPNSGTAGSRDLNIEARRISLSDVEPFVERFFPGSVCAGRVSCLIQARVLEDSQEPGLAGRIRFLAENVNWRQTSWVVGESLNLETVSGQGALALARDGIMISDLHLRSPILEVEGAGEVRAAVNDPVQSLRQAADRANAGQKQAVAEATAAAAGQVRINGRADLAAVGRMLPGTLRLAEGLQLQSADVRFSCRLQQAVSTPTLPEVLSQQTQPIQWQLAVETAPIRAQHAGRQLSVSSALRLDSQGNLTPVSFSADRVQLTGNFGKLWAVRTDNGWHAQGSVSPQQFRQDFQSLFEMPEAGLTGPLEISADYAAIDNAMQFSDVEISSDGFNVSGPLLVVSPNQPFPQSLRGRCSVSGTGRALKNVAAPFLSADWLADETQVNAQLESDPENRVRLQVAVSPLSTTSPGVRSGSAAAIQVRQGRASLNLLPTESAATYRVEQGFLEVPGLQADIVGTLSATAGLTNVDLTAKTTYDLAELLPIVAAPADISLAGTGTETFIVRGCPACFTQTDVDRHLQQSSSENTTDLPVLSPLSCSGRISWSGGQVFGMPAGPGTLSMQLNNGVLNCEPVQCTLGTGELNALPQWDLISNRIQLASGSRLQNVQLTPELCRQWMAWVSPLVSDAVGVNGLVSARVHQFDYFTESPSQSSVRAVLTIHNATASPGSSLAPLIEVIDLIDRGNNGTSRELVFPAQDVPVEMRDGMVTHNSLRMSLKGHELASSGTVAMDGRVQLVLDIPLGRTSASTGRGNSVRVPVGGTLQQPRIDASGLLQDLGRQQVEQQFNKQIDRGLNSLLNRLR
ncbi:MAG: hypothetical protein KDA89_07380 [Planctomycetaceae bacterium]|nr:hypothetical protein [Planctomycetaceae bacterium]